MEAMLEQSALWILTLGALVLYFQRRRKRRPE
jgi:MYXO-CTERM domain-containing protein